jgi:hypothetical protein
VAQYDTLVEQPKRITTVVPADERAARQELRRQIGRLERELSAILADRFPFLPAAGRDQSRAQAGPCLPDLAELERARDRLAAQLQDLRALARLRGEHERRSRELLERMRLEPGRYRYVRLPVSDLGEGGCGVWEVRPRLGLIGMLAGWWQLKLSSGCPLARGPRFGAAPAFPLAKGSRASARPRSRTGASGVRQAVRQEGRGAPSAASA